MRFIVHSDSGNLSFLLNPGKFQPLCLWVICPLFYTSFFLRLFICLFERERERERWRQRQRESKWEWGERQRGERRTSTLCTECWAWLEAQLGQGRAWSYDLRSWPELKPDQDQTRPWPDPMTWPWLRCLSDSATQDLSSVFKKRLDIY